MGEGDGDRVCEAEVRVSSNQRWVDRCGFRHMQAAPFLVAGFEEEGIWLLSVFVDEG